MSTDVRDELRTVLGELARARNEAQSLDARLREREAEWRERFERQHANEIAKRDAASQRAAELEARAKELAVQIARERGDKSPARGIRVKVVRRVQYDPDKAVRWAIERRATKVLALAGRRAFLDYLKRAGEKPDFVEEEEVYQAMITKELGAEEQAPAKEEHSEASDLPF